MRVFDRSYIAGGFRSVLGRGELAVIDPSTEERTGTLVLVGAEDARLAVAAATDALPRWRSSGRAERIELLEALARAVDGRASDLTEATVAEYGGPVEQARWRAGLAANNFRVAARALADFAFERRIGDADVVAQPVGVAAHIVPWNSVYNAISTKLGGALAAGCTVVSKPSEFGPLQAELFAECLHAGGMPPGIFNMVIGVGEEVGAALLAQPEVRKVSFTGSNAVGKSILRGSGDRLQRVTLELGGKSPTIIMEDADLTLAAKRALAIGFANNGQACIAGTRIIVPQRLLAAFCAELEKSMEGVVQGDPRDPRTTLGPLVNRRQYDRVRGYIRRGIEEGATPSSVASDGRTACRGAISSAPRSLPG